MKRHAAAAGLLAVLASACGGAAEEVRASHAGEPVSPVLLLPRMVRFTPMRPEPGSFFLDRFETTRADVDAFFAAGGGEVPGVVRRIWGGQRPGQEARGQEGLGRSLPASGLDLREARALARWRLGRLPTLQEWRYAAGSEAGYAFPWGDGFRGYLCNTAELGLLRPTPVGTFEPWRYARPDGSCYDLVGNLAELVFAPHTDTGVHWAGRPAPTEHLAVGWHFLTRYRQGMLPTVDGVEQVLPRDRSNLVGLRVATDPQTLLEALHLLDGALSPQEESTLRAFLHEHRAVLGPALGDREREVPGGGRRARDVVWAVLG